MEHAEQKSSRFRRWLRFSLRRLFVIITCCALLITWWITAPSRFAHRFAQLLHQLNEDEIDLQAVEPCARNLKDVLLRRQAFWIRFMIDREIPCHVVLAVGEQGEALVLLVGTKAPGKPPGFGAYMIKKLDDRCDRVLEELGIDPPERSQGTTRHTPIQRELLQYFQNGAKRDLKI